MSNSFSSSLIQEVNSGVSYSDTLGLYLGLSRFVGETNVAFLQRLYQSSIALKDSSVHGLIDVISLNLNLNINPAIQITTPVGAIVNIVPGVVMLNSTKIPVFNLAADTYMEWLMLSDVVNAINEVEGFSATLLISDRPALTLCKQANWQINLNEPVITANLTYTVKNSGLIEDTILFNLTPPSFTVDGDVITFSASPDPTLTISYQNINTPFTIVASDANLFGLVEPNLIAAATTFTNVLGYQLQEAIQDVMNIDQSYWTT